MPTIEAFHPRLLGPKDWGTELLIAQTDTYIGKVLTMLAGTSGPLQFHRHKDETFYLVSGEALVAFVTLDQIYVVPMQAGESYHIPPGAVHRVTAVTECVFFEASSPHFDDRVNVEHLYK